MSINSIKNGTSKKSVQFDPSKQAQQSDNQKNNGNRAATIASVTIAGVETGTAAPYLVTKKLAKKTKEDGNNKLTQVVNDLLENGPESAQEVLSNIKDFTVNIVESGEQKSVKIEPKEQLVKSNWRSHINEVREKTGKLFTDRINAGGVGSPYEYISKNGPKDVKKLLKDALGSFMLINKNGATVMEINPNRLNDLESNMLQDLKQKGNETGKIFGERISLDKLKEGPIVFEEEFTGGSKKLIANGAKVTEKLFQTRACAAGGIITGLGALGLALFLTKKEPQFSKSQQH